MRALEVDSTFVPAALELPLALTEERAWVQYAAAQRALRRTASTIAGADPRVLVIRSRIEREAGDRDSSLAVAQRAVHLGGGAQAQLDLARELFFIGDTTDAERAYWVGSLSTATTEDRESYGELIRPIATTAELAAYDSLPTSAVAAWLRRFWGRRDAADALAPGTRLREQFRRLEYAMAEFKVLRRRRPGAPRIDLLTDDLPTPADSASPDQIEQFFTDRAVAMAPRAGPAGWLDARGRMYLRHGPPDARAGSWWLYHRPGGDLLVQVDYSLPGSLCDLVQKYCLLELGGIRMIGQQRFRTWQKEQVQMLREALTTDDAAPRFEEPLNPVVQLYAVSALNGRRDAVGRVLATFAIPGRHLVPSDSAAGHPLYRIRLHLVAGAPGGSRRFDLDTVRTFETAAPLGDGQFLSATADLALPPGEYNARLVIEEVDSVPITSKADTSGFAPHPAAARGALVGLDQMRVSDPFGKRLALSDLVLGRAGSGLEWTPPGGRPVPLNPLNAYPPGGTIALYYQMSGLTAGAEYRTRVALAPADDEKGRAVVTLGFSDRASASYEEVRRSIDLAHVKPGHYQMTVTVRGPDGAEASRRGMVNVVEE